MKKRWKEWFLRKKTEKQAEAMDRDWMMEGKSSWELYPPSFYRTHLQEEQKRICGERMAKARKMVEELPESVGEEHRIK